MYYLARGAKLLQIVCGSPIPALCTLPPPRAAPGLGMEHL